jgi:hypothetical protein
MEIVIYQEGEEISYGGCRLSYYIIGFIQERGELVSRTPGNFAQDGIRVLRYRRIENINIENNRLSGRNLESGLRSYKACLRLQHKGFENVKKIDGRMLWFCYDLKSENKRNED